MLYLATQFVWFLIAAAMQARRQSPAIGARPAPDFKARTAFQAPMTPA